MNTFKSIILVVSFDLRLCTFFFLDNDDDNGNEYVNFQVIDEFNEKFGPAVSFTLNAFLLKHSDLMLMQS